MKVWEQKHLVFLPRRAGTARVHRKLIRSRVEPQFRSDLPVDADRTRPTLEWVSQIFLNSAQLLQKLLVDGLCVSPVTMVELSAAFSGDLLEQKHFLDAAGISYGDPWTSADMEASHRTWHNYVLARRSGQTTRRPVADLLIGGFASNRSGLVTRNPSDFHRWFPGMTIREP